MRAGAMRNAMMTTRQHSVQALANDRHGHDDGSARPERDFFLMTIIATCTGGTWVFFLKRQTVK